MHHLVYKCLGDEPRAWLLGHFQHQAEVLESSFPNRPVKLLSDVDDTLYVHWCCKALPSDAVFPGVRSYIQAVRDGSGAEHAGALVLLSARPSAMKNYTHRVLRELVRVPVACLPVPLSPRPSPPYRGWLCRKLLPRRHRRLTHTRAGCRVLVRRRARVTSAC